MRLPKRAAQPSMNGNDHLSAKLLLRSTALPRSVNKAMLSVG
jgi:hypothetical protein